MRNLDLKNIILNPRDLKKRRFPRLPPTRSRKKTLMKIRKKMATLEYLRVLLDLHFLMSTLRLRKNRTHIRNHRYTNIKRMRLINLRGKLHQSELSPYHLSSSSLRQHKKKFRTSLLKLKKKKGLLQSEPLQ